MPILPMSCSSAASSIVSILSCGRRSALAICRA
jgi:hypothetical protein